MNTNAFNQIIRSIRKENFGKGPENIKTFFIENIAISILQGNLTPTEKFIGRTGEGADVIHSARTKMIQEIYKNEVPNGLEELAGSKLKHLFNDIKVEEDIAISLFIFEEPIRIKDSIN